MIDGEGTIGLGRTIKPTCVTYAPYVHINNSYKPVLYWCVEVTGIGKVSPSRVDKRSNRKDMYRWWLTLPEIEVFLPLMQDFLVIKAEQCDLVLVFIEQCRTATSTLTEDMLITRAVIFEQLAELNKRGK